MADRGVLTVQDTSIDQLGVTALLETTTVTDGDSFTNDGNTYLFVDNSTTAATTTFTFQTPAEVAGGVSVEEHEVIVLANAQAIIGKFDAATFNQSNGRVYFVADPVTDVNVLAFKAK